MRPDFYIARRTRDLLTLHAFPLGMAKLGVVLEWCGGLPATMLPVPRFFSKFGYLPPVFQCKADVQTRPTAPRFFSAHMLLATHHAHQTDAGRLGTPHPTCKLPAAAPPRRWPMCNGYTRPLACKVLPPRGFVGRWRWCYHARWNWPPLEVVLPARQPPLAVVLSPARWRWLAVVLSRVVPLAVVALVVSMACKVVLWPLAGCTSEVVYQLLARHLSQQLQREDSMFSP